MAGQRSGWNMEAEVANGKLSTPASSTVDRQTLGSADDGDDTAEERYTLEEFAARRLSRSQQAGLVRLVADTLGEEQSLVAEALREAATERRAANG